MKMTYLVVGSERFTRDNSKYPGEVVFKSETETVMLTLTDADVEDLQQLLMAKLRKLAGSL